METKAEKQIRLLEGSVDKWLKIYYNRGEDHGRFDCPLCLMYDGEDYCNEDEEEGDLLMCFGCPVAEETGKENCAGTPYKKWFDNFGRCEERKVVDETSKDLAKAELDFLVSILDKLKSKVTCSNSKATSNL